MNHRVMYEMHSHTPLCGHAAGTPEDYAEAAWRRGLAGIAITCHNPLPDGLARASRMRLEQFPQYLDMVESARRQWAGRVEVLLGMECDFMPGLEPWLRRQLDSVELNHVLGSVHPQLHEYKEAYWRGDAMEYQRTYFEHLARAAETGLFDTLAHPDLVKNETADKWEVGRIMHHLRGCLDRIARSGVAMELNTSGVHKVIREMNPGIEILSEMRERGIPVVIGADAHVPPRVGDGFETALGLLREVGYSHASYFVCRQRRDVAIDDALASLRSNGSAADSLAVKS
jgi:histidinol-phosphatase (PHP family)